MLSYLVINEVELIGISGCSEPEEGLVYLKNHYPSLKIIITLGENGSVLFDGLKESKSNSQSQTLYEQIDSYIEQNIKTANLEELSQVLGYSAVYTGRIVNKLMGENFTKVVIAKRCKTAAYMLLNTNCSVHDIISTVGYENESFFRKTFKQKYGKTPLEYRKARNCYDKRTEN